MDICANRCPLKAILEPFNYIASMPGKNFRNQLLAAFNVWLKVEPEKYAIVVKIVSMLHNASLM